ncbi:long-chain fatty acid--CoA ligase [Frankia sp. CcI156]|uniref:AMP-dependent synthetase and ligase n=2 Tax=Frankia casuarinae (strain DSM 45818 / CECT 9043 / HFP020203 / CcI3) TaxID=106370 RepID=Q2JBN5_FRACC|nr:MULTISPECIES: AMP-dependent synthetase/ligase [Frankia]ABD11307.1 AMP-dependent synthetase and ligase [Frankia casuarinae]ETA00629.1 AMP-forming long-chain acyl-CoA synthetase [Frankia sp. CcI6]EYT90765.1 AMP-forming long-chain acyl-CoA synthetase [Frankia casuarinae]KDA41585.1 AMP-forming long-chain acyl-CoA synthetase [Frankia sp. BMG5.23]OAA20630.1 long-chain acyl-CoA synthetase [Frankia casuarinae]
MNILRVPGGTELPADRGLAAAVLTEVAMVADRPVLAHQVDGGWRDVTAGRFCFDVAAVARGLVAHDVGVGDRVAIMGRTGYGWAVADFAIWSIGAVTVPVYPTSSAHQVDHIIGDSKASWCFVETPDHERLVLSAGLPATRVWSLDEAVSALGTAGQSVAESEVLRRRDAVRADDLATIVYTSGTTGVPKGCLLTHANVFSAAVNSVERLDPVMRPATGSASTILFLPLSHVFGRVTMIGCLWAGVRTALLPDPGGLVPALRTFRPTFLITVPSALEKMRKGARAAAAGGLSGRLFAAAERTACVLGRARRGQGGLGLVTRLQAPLFDRLVYRRLRAAFGGRLRHVVCGGATLDPSTAEFLTGVGVHVLGAYGLTEASTAVSISAPGLDRPGSTGRPLPATTVAISDEGEVLVAGPQVSPGYWPDRTGAHEPWLRTGDLGRLDDDGYLHITGRIKEIIITTGGKNVSPAPLEDRIRLHPLVSNAIVIGENRPFVTALVTLDRAAVQAWARRGGHKLDEAAAHTDPRLVAEVSAAVDAANAQVSRAESVRKFRLLSHDFTIQGGQLTPSLKLRRAVIEEENAKEIEELYAS